MGRRKAKTAIITFILTLLIVGAIAGFICWKLVSEKQMKIDELNLQKADGQVYAFSRDLKANTVITPDDITVIDIKSISKTSGMFLVATGNYIDDNGLGHSLMTWKDSEGNLHNYAIHYVASTDKYGNELKSFTDVLIDEKIIGRMVKTNVAKNTPVLDSVLYVEDEEEPSKDIRIQEFNFLQIPSDVEEGDYIDVRITFPTGEDYRVLGAKRVVHSKKQENDGRGNNTIFLNLNEREIMTMTSAVIEAYMQKGVKLYSLKMVDPANQAFKETVEDYVEKYNKALELALLQKDFDKIVEAYNESTSGDTNPVPLELTFEQYKDMEEADRKAIGINFVPTKEEDLKDEDIYQFAGMRLEHVHAIREALKDAEANVNTINYYKAMRVKTAVNIATTYPVKKEVLAAIEKNPDITNIAFEYYSQLVNESTRYDKLVQLEKEYETAPEEKDMYSNQDVKTKKEILSEIKALLDSRADNINSNLETERIQQRKDRVDYLSTLLGTAVSNEGE
ncbi:MAG: hypothetical protein IKI57_00875 [Clostridia bacterium]|nr:hypothetical protein [Clostridia bacterium]